MKSFLIAAVAISPLTGFAQQNDTIDIAVNGSNTRVINKKGSYKSTAKFEDSLYEYDIIVTSHEKGKPKVNYDNNVAKQLNKKQTETRFFYEREAGVLWSNKSGLVSTYSPITSNVFSPKVTNQFTVIEVKYGPNIPGVYFMQNIVKKDKIKNSKYRTVYYFNALASYFHSRLDYKYFEFKDSLSSSSTLTRSEQIDSISRTLRYVRSRTNYFKIGLSVPIEFTWNLNPKNLQFALGLQNELYGYFTFYKNGNNDNQSPNSVSGNPSGSINVANYQRNGVNLKISPYVRVSFSKYSILFRYQTLRDLTFREFSNFTSYRDYPIFFVGFAWRKF